MSLKDVKPLSNFDINSKMKKAIGDVYIGTVDCDSFPTPPSTRGPWAFIANTEKDTTRKVGHWTAIVLDKSGLAH